MPSHQPIHLLQTGYLRMKLIFQFQSFFIILLSSVCYHFFMYPASGFVGCLVHVNHQLYVLLPKYLLGNSNLISYYQLIFNFLFSIMDSIKLIIKGIFFLSKSFNTFVPISKANSAPSIVSFFINFSFAVL